VGAEAELEERAQLKCPCHKHATTYGVVRRETSERGKNRSSPGD